MLDAGAETGSQQYQQQRHESANGPRRDESTRGDRGPRRQQAPLAPALGEEPRGDLERRHPAAVGGADQPDLREGQPELVGPDRQEHVEDVGESVVDEVDAAGGGEHRARARFHPSIIPERPFAFK